MVDAPAAATGPQVEHATALSPFLGGQNLWDGANVILSAKEELKHPMVELAALWRDERVAGGMGDGAYPDLLLVCGKHVALAEGVETPPVYFREELGVVFADIGDLVEREYYGVVESHGGEDMVKSNPVFPDLYLPMGGEDDEKDI